MKSLKKLFMLLLAASALSFTFTACSDDDDDDTVAVYKCEKADNSLGVSMKNVMTVTFKDDNTFVVHENSTASASGQTLTFMNLDAATGTYEGDPSKDGTVKVTIKKAIDEDSIDAATMLAKLSSGSTITNSDLPLKDVTNPTTEEITISNGKFTFDEAEFTKQ